jgi:hypothetical protein
VKLVCSQNKGREGWRLIYKRDSGEAMKRKWDRKRNRRRSEKSKTGRRQKRDRVSGYEVPVS